MATDILCPICGQQNSTESHFCTGCRANLSQGNIVAGEAAEEQHGRRLAAARRKRLTIWGIVAAMVLVIGGWMGYTNLGPARFLPPPFSEITAAPVGGDWPMFQRDPAHRAFVTGEGIVPMGRLKWRFDIDAPIFSSPAVVGDLVYLSTGDGRVLALDAASGNLLWEYEVGAPVNSSPAVAGDLVFIGLRDGRVLALNREAGEIQWEFKTGELVYSSPAVYQGVVYIGSGDGRLYALDAISGEERWSYLTGGRVTSGPAVNQEVTAFVSQDRYLYLIDTSTGKRRLGFPTSPVGGSPTIHENLVLIADKDGVVRAIDWRKRELPLEKVARRVRTQLFIWGMVGSLPPHKGFVWGFRESGESFVGTPVVANGAVYIGSASGTLFALNESTGELVWKFRGEVGITTSPSVAGETVFVGDENGRLYAINALTGGLQWQFMADASISSTPVIANGTLYITSMGGTLYAIQ
ncbi:MAG: PQQ-binding-like beta-propeller repeat protein [Chloroflexi bacterium]|nr:PQQ-binding-like beta-propeller repeat protein [Chloroflexota bacterium]